MNTSIKLKGLMKKAIAVTLGITLAFGALALPGITPGESFTTASAYSAEIGDCKFTYYLTDRTGTDTVIINDVTFTGDTVEIPSTITHNGVEYPVTDINDKFLYQNSQIKTITIPDSVTYIGDNVLYWSSVEKIVLSNKLEHIGREFASYSFNLETLDCKSTNTTISEMPSSMLNYCNKLRNEKGAICLGNWLIDYEMPKDMVKAHVSELKIKDLGNDDIPIDSLSNNAITSSEYVTTIDLEGIKRIGYGQFSHFFKLSHVVNADSVVEAGENMFQHTPWLKEAKENHIARFGPALFYYRSDEKVIDFTSGELEGVKNVLRGAMEDCTNVETLICPSDIIFSQNSLHKNYDQSGDKETVADSMPLTPTYNLKNVYIDGKKVTNDSIWNDPKIYEWMKNNSSHLRGAVFQMDMINEKMPEVFEQLDIPYYGLGNDMLGTNSPTEEFYIRLKVHNYLSQFDYDHGGVYGNPGTAVLLGGKLDCMTYATLTQYMLECAGVDCRTYDAPTHFWNITKIGDEWFENDDGWNAQNHNHAFGWFGLSTEELLHIDGGDPKIHTYVRTYDTFHAVPHISSSTTEHIIAERTIGDVDQDGDRDKDDVDKLWSLIKGEVHNTEIKPADVNFDGNVNVTDAVLLDQLVNSKVLPHEEFVIDGYSQKVKIAFLNGTDYDNIQYLYTDREGYIKLPADLFEAPEGKKLSYDVGKVGETVRLTNPLTVVNVKWIDASEPDYSEPDSSTSDSSKLDSSTSDSSKPDSSISEGSSSKPDSSDTKEDKSMLGDVNGDRSIDIEDAVAIIQHINGMTPLKADEEKRADVSKDKNIDIDDAVILISYINGNSTF